MKRIITIIIVLIFYSTNSVSTINDYRNICLFEEIDSITAQNILNMKNIVDFLEKNNSKRASLVRTKMDLLNGNEVIVKLNIFKDRKYITELIKVKDQPFDIWMLKGNHLRGAINNVILTVSKDNIIHGKIIAFNEYYYISKIEGDYCVIYEKEIDTTYQE